MNDSIKIQSYEDLTLGYKYVCLFDNSIADLNDFISKIALDDKLLDVSLFDDAKLKISNMVADSYDLKKQVNDVIDALIKADAALADTFKDMGISLGDTNQNTIDTSGLTLGKIYDQYDGTWKNVPYVSGTLEKDGCGFFSVLSAIAAKRGKVFTHDEVVDMANQVMLLAKPTNNVEGMESLLESLAPEYNFTFEKVNESWNTKIPNITKALEDGKVVIGLTPSGSIEDGTYNSSGHFVPLTGILDNGNVVINDSNGYKYTGKNLERYNELGFNLSDKEFDITTGNTWYIDFGDD